MSTVCVFFYLYSCHHSPRFLLHRIDMIVVSLSARVYMLIVVYFSGIQHENHSKISYKRLYSRKTLYNIQNMFFISFSLQINWQREKKTQISNFVASFVWNRMQCNRFCCYGQIYQTLDVKWKFHMFLYRNYVFSCFAIYFSLPHLKHTRIIDKTRTSKFYKTKIRCLWSTYTHTKCSGLILCIRILSWENNQNKSLKMWILRITMSTKILQLILICTNSVDFSYFLPHIRMYLQL